MCDVLSGRDVSNWYWSHCVCIGEGHAGRGGGREGLVGGGGGAAFYLCCIFFTECSHFVVSQYKCSAHHASGPKDGHHRS